MYHHCQDKNLLNFDCFDYIFPANIKKWLYNTEWVSYLTCISHGIPCTEYFLLHWIHWTIDATL